MKTKYSKPSNDIAFELVSRASIQFDQLAMQKKVSSHIEGFEKKDYCILCSAQFNVSAKKTYTHRKVRYIFCGRCGHFQTEALLPNDYPYRLMGSGFEFIYPELSTEQFISRRDRIYHPKLDWGLSCLMDYRQGKIGDYQDSWLELGCGAGYFLSALHEGGFQNIVGLDINPTLVDIANKNIPSRPALVTPNLFDSLRESNANIIVAFYVLEHINDGREFWNIMKNKPSGTIFIFAVPVFGMSTIFEGSFDGFPSRNLDNVIHTQLFTDQSLKWSLDYADYKIIGEWIFGQDSQDILLNITTILNSIPDNDLRNFYTKKVNSLVDEIQGAIDRSRLSDSRHIIAVKN
jgi:2-polyprenyl-3-methyl-5-hydroxy-6-metoxy-1,4-benzoquinol methylase